MKKILLFIVALIAATFSAQAQNGPNKINRYTDIELSYVPTSSYEPVSTDLANYYFVATSGQSNFDSTTGELQIGNGTVRVTDGARFTALSRVFVGATGVLAVGTDAAVGAHVAEIAEGRTSRA